MGKSARLALVASLAVMSGVVLTLANQGGGSDGNPETAADGRLPLGRHGHDHAGLSRAGRSRP